MEEVKAQIESGLQADIAPLLENIILRVDERVNEGRAELLEGVWKKIEPVVHLTDAIYTVLEKHTDVPLPAGSLLENVTGSTAS